MLSSSMDHEQSHTEPNESALPMYLFWSLVMRACPSNQSGMPYLTANGERFLLMSLAASETTANGLKLCSHWEPMLIAVMDSVETLQSEILLTCSTQCGL